MSDPSWTTPLTLPGQAAATPGPVDVNNMYVLHHAFRRDLGNFVAAAQQTPLDDRAAWRALSDRWNTFAHELHLHHQHEDQVLWPVLASRVDDKGRGVLEDMESEHSGIDPILAEIASGFASLAAAADEEARSGLVERLLAGRANLDGHLAHEETAAIPLIQQHCSQRDWAAFEKAAQKDGGIAGLLTIVPWAAYGLDEDLRTSLFAAGPPLLKIVWRLTHGRFDRREQLTFRYVQ